MQILCQYCDFFVHPNYSYVRLLKKFITPTQTNERQTISGAQHTDLSAFFRTAGFQPNSISAYRRGGMTKFNFPKTPQKRHEHLKIKPYRPPYHPRQAIHRPQRFAFSTIYDVFSTPALIFNKYCLPSLQTTPPLAGRGGDEGRSAIFICT